MLDESPENLGESPKNDVEREKSIPQLYIRYNSVYIEFPKWQNSEMGNSLAVTRHRGIGQEGVMQ